MIRIFTALTLGWSCALLGAGEPAKPFKQTANEVKVFELTNQERKKDEKPVLVLSPALSKLARAHSENMAKQGKMEHKLDGKEVSDRILESGYLSSFRGENIAFGEGATIEMILKAWMESEGHRKNILHKDYAEIGVGIARDKTGILYYTQVFARPRKK